MQEDSCQLLTKGMKDNIVALTKECLVENGSLAYLKNIYGNGTCWISYI